jgi:hypothetical protein
MGAVFSLNESALGQFGLLLTLSLVLLGGPMPALSAPPSLSLAVRPVGPCARSHGFAPPTPPPLWQMPIDEPLKLEIG